MSGFNRKFKVSNNYISACRSKNKVRVYTYSTGTYYFDNGVKTPIKVGDIINNKKVVNKGEYHHSKNKYGYNSVMFWELVELDND